MVNMFDASSPPAHAPPGFQIAAGYIGGHTPHVWTKAEWQRFRGLKMLPIYVSAIAIHQQSTPVIEAFDCLRKLHALGVPHGSPVVIDLETAVNPAYVTAFGGVLHWANYRVWVYGSASTVFGNPPLDGYWVADYTGASFMYAHQKVRATQWINGTDYDRSEVKYWQYRYRLKSWL
jgi:hypothetical protein